jgi:hypothetical protein
MIKRGSQTDRIGGSIRRHALADRDGARPLRRPRLVAAGLCAGRSTNRHTDDVARSTDAILRPAGTEPAVPKTSIR